MVKLDAYNNYNSITHTHTHARWIVAQLNIAIVLNMDLHFPHWPPGVARGCGRQHLGAYVNLGAYYLVGLPAAVVLGFVFGWRGKGLWLGLNLGSLVQSTLLSVVTCSTDWRKQVNFLPELYANVLLHFVSSVIGLIYAVVLIINTTGINGSSTNIRGHNSSGS